MIDQVGVFRTGVCAMGLAFCTALAQETADNQAGEVTPVAAVTDQADVKSVVFTRLVRVTNMQGACEVKTPDNGSFELAQQEKYYPMGTIFRTGTSSSVILLFSANDFVKLEENSEVTIISPEGKADARVAQLSQGHISTTLRDNLAEGLFAVSTPNSVCRNVSGRGVFKLIKTSEFELFHVATITGAMRVEGPQYTIAALRAANTLEIQTAPDRSLSRLTSVSGDFAISLENGTDSPVTFGMTPKAVVKIWRENAPVGGRSIISTLVVSPTGIARHRFVYAEGRSVLTTGEMISPEEVARKEAEQPLFSVVPNEKVSAKGAATDGKSKPSEL